MKEKVLRMALLAGAAALCIWGVRGILTRPAPGTGGGEAASEEWELLLPDAPPEGLSPGRSEVIAGESPSDAGLLRTLSLPDGSKLRLDLAGDAFPGERFRLNEIFVYRDGKQIQTIVLDAPYFCRDPAADALETGRTDFGFSSGDYNFDGQIDFSVANSFVREDGCQADYAFHFLWSPERGYFVPAPELDALPSPVFSREDGTVSCSYSGAERSGKELYRWERGELLGVEKRERVIEAGRQATRSFLWENGGWVPRG